MATPAEGNFFMLANYEMTIFHHCIFMIHKSNFKHQLSWMLNIKKYSGTSKIFFLFTSETFKVQWAATFRCKWKKRFLFVHYDFFIQDN